MTLNQSTDETLAEYFRSIRTLSENDVHQRTALHDLNDLTPQERSTTVGSAS